MNILARELGVPTDVERAGSGSPGPSQPLALGRRDGRWFAMMAGSDSTPSRSISPSRAPARRGGRSVSGPRPRRLEGRAAVRFLRSRFRRTDGAPAPPSASSPTAPGTAPISGSPAPPGSRSRSGRCPVRHGEPAARRTPPRPRARGPAGERAGVSTEGPNTVRGTGETPIPVQLDGEQAGPCPRPFPLPDALLLLRNGRARWLTSHGSIGNTPLFLAACVRRRSWRIPENLATLAVTRCRRWARAGGGKALRVSAEAGRASVLPGRK